MMKKTKVILCDANIIFGILRRIILGEPITHSALFELSLIHDVYVSKYIISELATVYERDYNLILKNDHIKKFFDRSGFLYIDSKNNLDPVLLNFVSDIKDAPILQDAIAISADFLLTKNMNDFDVPGIRNMFHILVIDSIPF